MRQLLLALMIVIGAAGAAAGAGPNMGARSQDPDDNKELIAKACATQEVDHDFGTDKKQHPTPEASLGQALIYVVRPTMYGNGISTRLNVDKTWVGGNRGKNYFFFTLDPGEHFFCSKAENRSVLALTVEAGKTYYIQQKIRSGFLKARNQLEVQDDVEGKKALADCRLSTWQEKKRK